MSPRGREEERGKIRGESKVKAPPLCASPLLVEIPIGVVNLYISPPVSLAQLLYLSIFSLVGTSMISLNSSLFLQCYLGSTPGRFHLQVFHPAVPKDQPVQLQLP